MLVAYLALVVHQLSQPPQTTSQTFLHKSQGRSTERHEEPKRLADTANAHPCPQVLAFSYLELLSGENFLMLTEFPDREEFSMQLVSSTEGKATSFELLLHIRYNDQPQKIATILQGTVSSFADTYDDIAHRWCRLRWWWRCVINFGLTIELRCLTW